MKTLLVGIEAFFVNRGSHDGVAPEMAVTVAEGIVGRVTRCSDRFGTGVIDL